MDDEDWYREDLIREHNPLLDEIQGHRGFVPPGDYDASSWDALVDAMVTGRRSGRIEGGTAARPRRSARSKKRERSGDVVVDRGKGEEAPDVPSGGAIVGTSPPPSSSPAKKKKKTIVRPVPFRRRRGLPRARPERMQLCTTDFRPSLVARAVFAGLFPFASELENFPGKALEERCLLNLELGGAGRRRDESRPNDCGGRVVLAAEEAVAATAGVFAEGAAAQKEREKKAAAASVPAMPLLVGKKTLRAVRAAGPGSLIVRLTADVENVLDGLVRTHGVDWIGFRRVRELLGAAPSAWEGKEARPVAIELRRRSDETCNNGEGGGTLISGEIGFLCGSCYSCLSLFSDDSEGTGLPRCGRIRAEGAALLLIERGVRLIDVGTSADYFGQFGFQKTTRREFVCLWRRWRSVPLAANVDSCTTLEDDVEMSGEELVQRMEAQRAAMRDRTAT